MTEYHVLNLGAGVQSTTLYLMAMEKQVQAIDCAIFADTGEEPKAVYRHLEWLQSLNGPPILIGSAGSRLGDDLVYGTRAKGRGKRRFASIPAFVVNPDGTNGQTKRQCSYEYKVRVIEKDIRYKVLKLKPRQRLPKDTIIHQYFGISLDEQSRATRIWERFHVTGECPFKPHFPLIDRMMTRANCIDWLTDRVPHQVPRSACVFCPFHTDNEWQQLKDRGGNDWERAIQIDCALRLPGTISNEGLVGALYLHSDRKPLVQVDFHSRPRSKELQLGFGIECEGVCGV